jgi:hypothetical protein
MKRVAMLCALMAMLLPRPAAAQVVESLREQLRIRESVREGQLQDLAKVLRELREEWSALEQQSGNLLRAQNQAGVTVDDLRLRDADLRRIESSIRDGLLEAQQLRHALLENSTMLAALNEEIERLSGGAEIAAAPLTGTWDLVVEPGQEGVAYLQQQGTLVTGTYALSGGFSGSFRGTFVAGKVRLERIDSQIGFAAIFYGRLAGSGRNRRLQGNWEATQLASGLPSAGNWTARIMEAETE